MKSATPSPPRAATVQVSRQVELDRREAAVLDSYDRHDPIIRAYVHSKIHHHADAQDVVQEIWKKVLVKAPESKIGHLPWLMRMARFTMGDHFRKRETDKREVPTEEIDSVKDPQTTEVSDSPEADTELRRQFFGNFPDIGLSELHKEILWLHGRHGLTLEEISERTGVAPSTIHDWINKGRAAITQSLES